MFQVAATTWGFSSPTKRNCEHTHKPSIRQICSLDQEGSKMLQHTTKWADYVIVAVRYNESLKNHRRHIDQVEVKSHNGQVFGASQYFRREMVVSQIESWKRTFVTARKLPTGWVEGADVDVIDVGGVKYIRTDNNHTTSDNLGNLPEF